MKYDALLMLSGGKDSCSLAIKLKSNGLNILAVTVDNGFLSPTAVSNIIKIVDHLGMDLVSVRPRKTLYEGVIEKLYTDDKSCMDTICGECSAITTSICARLAAAHGVDTMYAGFTKYTAEAAGWSPDKVKMIGGIKLINPYYEAYDLKAIIKQLEDLGLVWDPVRTNCIFIDSIIKLTNSRYGTNHLVKEVELLYKDGQIDDGQRKYYGDFASSK